MASIKLFLALARADGTVDDEEERMVAVLAKQQGVEPSELDDVNVEEQLAKVTSAEAKEFVFRCAVALASVDGKCTATEHALLSKMRDALAPGETVPLEVMEADWAARMKTARGAMDRATDAFMDAIGARSGSIPRADYERLIAELDAKKSAALRSALAASR